MSVSSSIDYGSHKKWEGHGAPGPPGSDAYVVYMVRVGLYLHCCVDKVKQ